MNSVEQHAVSLAVDNEETEGFNTVAFMYALSRWHGRKQAERAVTRLLAKNVLSTNGRTIFVTDPESWS